MTEPVLADEGWKPLDEFRVVIAAYNPAGWHGSAGLVRREGS